MSALSASKILIKGSSIPDKIPALSSLEPRELAVNTTDGKIFTKTSDNNIVTFLNSSEHPLVLNQSLSSTVPQFGSNNVSGVFGAVLNGFNNDISGSGSTVANGENNDIASDFSFIGSGLNNNISLTADYGAILGGSNNTLNHQQSFIIGSNITSHAENFTYVNNLSVVGKIYGNGDNLTNVAGDRYFTTSITANTISNSNGKVFVVERGLSYIPTQDITFVYDNAHHMHGVVVDYNTLTGYLTADITTHTGSGTYSNWKVNIGSNPNFSTSVFSSDVEITDPTKGVILRSPNNSRWRITVSNSGAIQVTAV